MKSTFFAASLLATAAIARNIPHARHHKRYNDVVWVTDIDFVTEVVGLTTTFWVTSNSKITVSPTRQADDAKTTSTVDGAPQFFQGGNGNAQAAAPVPTTTEVAVAPPVVETSAPAAPAPNPPVVDSPAAADPPAADPPTTVATSTTPAAVAAPSPPPASSSPSNTGSGSGSSSGGQCSEGSPCNGDITYYDTGLGACGITSVDTEKVVALPHGLMGTQSNGNPYCGRTIAIESGGKTTTATVVDKCMGCEGFSIDLSPAAFDALADASVGRTTANWYFTS